MTDTGLILKIEGISKSYGGVQALDHVNLEVNYGEVHALVGENGAGKSTLMKILGGIVNRDSGKILFKGEEVDFQKPMEAISAGIAIIHQELSMIPALNVIENIFMGRMPNTKGRIHWKEAEEETVRLLDMVGLAIDPHTLVSNLSISQRQLIEIAKALSKNASLIVMDEPNSSLSESETDRLFQVIQKLKNRNVAVIYVSHKIEEVLFIADRITVMRDAHYVGTINKSEATVAKIIQMMVGRELLVEYVPPKNKPGEVILEVRGLCGERFKDVSFCLHKGEIVGMAGLVGAGRSEVARTIFGDFKKIAGEIFFEGSEVNFHSPAEAIRAGISMLQEDRKVLSLFFDLPIIENMSIANLPKMTRRGFINFPLIIEKAKGFVKDLDIKLASIDNPAKSLSGGNQQKVILARWLETNPKLLILDEPTHGVDVGAKSEIYQLIRNLSERGVSILLISSELPEIIAMSDRVVVMHEGKVTGTLPHEDCTEDNIMAHATGLQEQMIIGCA